MIRLMLLILLISANYMKLNCDEEPNTTESAIEETELRSADPELLQSKAENEGTQVVGNNAREVTEEIRVSRSSLNQSAKSEARFDDAPKIQSTDVPITEKSISVEDIPETGRRAEKEVEEPKVGESSTEALQDNAKSVENVENKVQELSENSRSASESEDRITEELSEASAESKLNDNESTSSNVESDRSSKTKEITDKSDKSDLSESVGTRRMLSGPDNIVIDTKTESSTTPKAVELDAKNAFKPTVKTYNNLNEFATDRNIKLVESSPTEPSPPTVRATTPTVTNLATQEILNQQFLPKFYPRPELNMHFPNINSDFQGPRDMPIYLKVKQDEYQLNNQFIGPQKTKSISAEENVHFNLNHQQEHRQSQSMRDIPGILTNKQFEGLRTDTRNQASRFYQDHVSNSIGFTENKQLANQNPDTSNQVQQWYHNEEKMNSDYKRLHHINRESRHQMQGMVNSEIPQQNNEQGNQYPLFRQSQDTRDMKINLENNQFGSERFANPYPYMHLPSPPQLKVYNTPARYANIIPTNIQILFQKLASASEHATKLPTNLYRNNIIPNYPYLDNPDYRNNFSLQGHVYNPHFQQRN